MVALVLALVPAGWAQTDAPKPEELSKQRKDLYLRATRAPLADLAKDVDRIAVLSENCRVKYGSAACGLSDKALDADKLEDRYDYYVKQPVEAHAKTHSPKVDRHNWGAPDAPAHP
jgi:hypothetical protein